MSQLKKSTFKPFIRVTLLSVILALLLIYLGINFHWGDYLKPKSKPSTKLIIPEKTDVKITIEANDSVDNNFNPEIINSQNSNAILDSMNKDQIALHCSNLLSKEINDQVTLELATVNCVMSNYQETFQDLQTTEIEMKSNLQKQLTLKKQCILEYNQMTQHSQIDKELLIGICVSDRMNSVN